MLELIDAPTTDGADAAAVADLRGETARSGPGARQNDPPEVTLELLGRTLSRLLARPDRPARWGARGFARQVETVRGQLRPIRSRHALASSYAREHLHLGTVGPAPSPTELLYRSPTDVAYAHRWLELGRRSGVASGAAFPDR